METFFYSHPSDGNFVATGATVGPWDPKLQHGGPLAALHGTRIERVAKPGMRLAHFAMEFLAPVAVGPLDVATAALRPGKKIELWSATSASIRATAWLLRVGVDRAESVGQSERVPPMPDVAASTYFKTVPRFGYGDALEWRFAEGGFESLGPAAVWSKLRVAIVEGEDVTPLARVLAMIDSANGISAELDVAKYLFVPVNLTVSLARYPEGDWVGMRAETSVARDGIGTTRARIFDAGGTIGRALQTLYVDRR